MIVSAMPTANLSQHASVDPGESPSVIRRKFCWNGNRRDIRAFPHASASPELPPALPDDLIDFYGLIFCQGGFRHLGMTFEQFLLAVATALPGRWRPAFEYDGDRFQ
jgi:hypothetical protein